MIFLALLLPPFLLLGVLALGRWEDFELSHEKLRRQPPPTDRRRDRPAHARRGRTWAGR